MGLENLIVHMAFAGTWRVGGVLAMSRAFGNRLLKQFVVAEPEIQVTCACIVVFASSQKRHRLFFHSLYRKLSTIEVLCDPLLFCQEQEIDDELEFLILASDGLWDVVPNEVSLLLCIDNLF